MHIPINALEFYSLSELPLGTSLRSLPPVEKLLSPEYLKSFKKSQTLPKPRLEPLNHIKTDSIMKRLGFIDNPT